MYFTAETLYGHIFPRPRRYEKCMRLKRWGRKSNKKMSGWRNLIQAVLIDLYRDIHCRKPRERLLSKDSLNLKCRVFAIPAGLHLRLTIGQRRIRSGV